MLKSMTGFGRSITDANDFVVTVELKTLNSKQTDIYCRLPRALSNKEIEIRNLLSADLERGKIELNINIQKNAEKEASIAINKSLVAVYFSEIIKTGNELEANMDSAEAFKIALTLPNAYNSENISDSYSDDELYTINTTLKEAITACNEFRIREGKILEEKFIEYIKNISNHLSQVELFDLKRIPIVREKIRKSVLELIEVESFDSNRFEQELIYYIEKYDISEEKQRLATHLQYFIEILKEEGNGKKLNFMAQELGREINTIGSKANDVNIQHLVVNMKEELEKIKEQTANIL